MSDIYEKIDEIGEYIEQAKVIPVLNQKVLDVNYLMRALEELYASVPAEIKEAREVLRDAKIKQEEIQTQAEELMNKTKRECEKMMAIAQNESHRLVEQHEIRSMAEEQARMIQSQVIEEIEAMRREAFQEIEELRKETLEKARMLEERAMQRAHEIKAGADKYAEDVLNHIDATVAQIQAVSKSGRKYFIEHSEKDLMGSASLN
jgi:hypothetical protein